MTRTAVRRVARSRRRAGVARALRFIVASALLLLASAAPAQALHQDPNQLPIYSFESIEIPGASVTQAWGINDAGDVVGFYVASGVTHGFLRSGSDGTYTTVDVPGATFTRVTSINDHGDLVGTYRLPADPVLHAFLLRGHAEEAGIFATIDVPDATASTPRGLNKHDDVVFEAVVGGVTHAYLLSDGTNQVIDPPESFAGGPVIFSYASGIDKYGDIVGRYDSLGTNRGYLRDTDGDYSLIDFPGSTSSAALGIDKAGNIVGGYTTAGVRHGYVLLGGTYTSLDVPGCVPTLNNGVNVCTTPFKMNDAGQIAGFYGLGGTTTRGFVATRVG